MQFDFPKSLKPVWDFSIHVVVGALLFLLVFLMAVLIAYVVHTVRGWGFAPVWLQSSANYAEALIFGLDMAGFVLFLIAETAKLLRQIWLSVKADYGR